MPAALPDTDAETTPPAAAAGARGLPAQASAMALDASASDEIRAAVEDGLKPHARLLPLLPALEARYQAATWQGRSRGIRTWLLVVAALHLIWIAIDWMIMPAHLQESILLRGVVSPAIFLGAAALIVRQRPDWMLGSAVLVTTLALILVNGYFAAIVGGVHAERLNTGALFVAFATFIVLPIPFVFAIAQAVLSLLIVGGLLVAGGHSLADSVQLFVFYPVTMLSALAAKRRFERMHRRIFLHRLRDELRVKDLAAANDLLTTLSHTDPLTGVFNRRHFDAAFAAAWSDAVTRKRWLGVMMVDVDHFKALNDAAGHAEGDQCLQQIAATLRGQVRADVDLVARYGGEEFVVILPAANLETALLVAERMRASVEGLAMPNPGLPGGGVVTVSIGLAAVAAADGTSSPQALLQAADIALYAAKATGRNYVCGHADDGAALISVADAPTLASSD